MKISAIYLPDEIWTDLFLSNFKKEQELTAIELVCKKFHEIVHKDIFWSESLINRFITPENNKCKIQLINIYSNFIKFTINHIKDLPVNEYETKKSLTIFEKKDDINVCLYNLDEVADFAKFFEAAMKASLSYVPLILEAISNPEYWKWKAIVKTCVKHSDICQKLIKTAVHNACTATPSKEALDKAAESNPDLVPLLLEKGCQPDSFTVSLVAEHHAHLIPKLLEKGPSISEYTLRVVLRFATDYFDKIIEHCRLQKMPEPKIRNAIDQGNRDIERFGRTSHRKPAL